MEGLRRKNGVQNKEMVVGEGYRTELRAWGVRGWRKKGVQNKEIVVGKGYRTEL